jgi:DNA-binding HxlR family transcriptional regulator
MRAANPPLRLAVTHDSRGDASAGDREMIAATNEALALFEAKWKVDVLYLLAAGIRRRTILHDHLLVSKRVLTDVLRALERDGLVRRSVLDGAPVRIEYALTPLGRSLTGPLFALYEWAAEHTERVVQAREDYDARSLADDGGDPVSRLANTLRIAS